MRRLIIAVVATVVSVVTAVSAAAQTSDEIYQFAMYYLDSDRNAVVSRGEFDRYWRDEPGSFDDYDVNRDGVLYGQELQGALYTLEEYMTYECDPELDSEFVGAQYTCLTNYLTR